MQGKKSFYDSIEKTCFHKSLDLLNQKKMRSKLIVNTYLQNYNLEKNKYDFMSRFNSFFDGKQICSLIHQLQQPIFCLRKSLILRSSQQNHMYLLIPAVEDVV